MFKFYLKSYLRRKLCFYEEALKEKKSLYNKDTADGTLVFVMISLPMLVLVMVLNLTIAQTSADSAELNSLIQRSAQAGVSKVNAYGSLNKNAVVEVVRNIQREQNTSNDNTYGNGGDHISTRFCTKTIENESGIALTGSPAAYYIEITLNDERSIDTEKNTGNASNTLNYTGFENGTTSPAILTDMRNLGVDENSRMKVINVNAKINLRSYWSMPGMDSCRTHTINVSAITLGSSQDVDYDEDFTLEQAP